MENQIDQFDDQAVCELCCGQNGAGAYNFNGSYVCEDCALGLMADLHNQQTDIQSQKNPPPASDPGAGMADAYHHRRLCQGW